MAKEYVGKIQFLRKKSYSSDGTSSHADGLKLFEKSEKKNFSSSTP